MAVPVVAKNIDVGVADGMIMLDVEGCAITMTTAIALQLAETLMDTAAREISRRTAAALSGPSYPPDYGG